jgi:23S rRNA pseudouridine2605 synthase
METEADIAKAREAQEIADGHRYRTQAFDDAREAQKPGAEFKKAAPKKKLKDANPKGGERIAKVLARAGLASRREIERLVGLGKIAVNGRILETPAVLVSAQDTITVEGRPIGKAEPTRLWRYHKPVGLMTTHSDPQGRPTVFENMPQPMPRVISVGRLDMNSEGLLLLTNDGELARALELPATGWVRIYRARALGHTSQAQLDRLKNGTTVDGVIYGPMEATLDKKVDKADGRANVWLTISITEGKNREVRKVLESIGLKVNRLIRLAYGPFQLGNLESGDVEEVGPRVIRELLSDKIDARNLPPEGASQTLDAPKARAPRGAAAPQGRRGGGDRFKSSAPKGEKPFGDMRPPRREFVEKREYKDRDFDERPRFEGDGEARDRREWKPRPEGRAENRDRAPAKKPYAAKTFGEKPAGERAWKPRPEGASAERKTWTPRPERGGDERPRFKPREDREGGGERKAYGAKPRFERDGFTGRPAFRKPYAKKPFGDDIPAGEAGAYERAKREFGGGDQRPKRDFAGRPQGERPAFKKAYKPREDADRKPYGKPRFDRDERPQGDRAGGRTFKPREERDSNDRPRGPRPAFNRSGESRPGGYKPGGFKGKPGGRPAGKPGGFARKPRED